MNTTTLADTVTPGAAIVVDGAPSTVVFRGYISPAAPMFALVVRDNATGAERRVTVRKGTRFEVAR